MVNLSGYLQSANTVGVINCGKAHGAGKHKLQSNVLLKGEAELAKAFKLDEPSNCNQNLVNALKKVIQEAGISPLSADSSAILEEVGKLMNAKQSKREVLEPKQITMLQDMYIIIKLARKLNDKTDNCIRFKLFNDFERGNRFSYSNDGCQINIDSNNRTGGKDSTSWTSFIKDTLAYNVTLSTQKKSIADIFKSVGQPVTEKSAKELLQRLNPGSNPVTKVRPSLQQPTIPQRKSQQSGAGVGSGQGVVTSNLIIKDQHDSALSELVKDLIQFQIQVKESTPIGPDPEHIEDFFDVLQLNLDQDPDPLSPILNSVIDAHLAPHINALASSHNVKIDYKVGTTTVKECIELIKEKKTKKDSEINRREGDLMSEFEQFNMAFEDKRVPELGSSGRSDTQIDMAFEIIEGDFYRYALFQ